MATQEEALKGVQGAFVPETEEQRQALAGIAQEFKPSPTPTNGQVEIKTDGAPPLPTVAGDVVANGNGATVSGQTTIDQLQKRIDELAAQKPSEEVAEQKKSILDLITKRKETRETQKSAVELRQEALTQAYSEMGVTPEQIQKIGGLIGEVTTYNQQIADIETRKQAALDAVEGRPGQDLAFMGREMNRVSKQYNSEISAKALQAGVKVQELQMIQGAYDDAKATATQIVNLATYDQQQEVADIEWALNAHQDLYNLLSGEEQTQWNRQYTMAKDSLDSAKKTLTDRSNYVVDPATADAFKGIDWTSLTDEEFTNTLAKYTSSQEYLTKLAQIGAAGRAPETQNEDFNSDMAMVSTYGDRDTALTTLNNMKTALVNKYGANRYQQLLSEVDRIFPAPEPKVSKPPSLPGVAEAGKATKSFLKEAFAGEFSTKYIGEPVLKAGQAVSSFWKGLFGG